MHAAPNDWAELERELVALAASGAVEVREDGEWLAELTGLHCEVHHQGKNPLIHLWSDERNLTRRLLRVKEWNPDRILLEVQRFGKAKPGQLEFLLRDNSRSAGRITREQFRARFARILAEKFPDSIVDSLTSSPDLEHSFSGLYVRGTMHEGRGTAGRCSPRAPVKRTPSRICSRLGFCGWIGRAIAPRSAASKVCVYSFRKEPAVHCANAHWVCRTRPKLKFSRCANRML